MSSMGVLIINFNVLLNQLIRFFQYLKSKEYLEVIRYINVSGISTLYRSTGLVQPVKNSNPRIEFRRRAGVSLAIFSSLVTCFDFMIMQPLLC